MTDPERCEIDWGPVPPVCKIHGTRVWECFAKLSSELAEVVELLKAIEERHSRYDWGQSTDGNLKKVREFLARSKEKGP